MTRRRPPYQSRRRVVRYGDDPSQVGELFLPAGGAPSPVAVVLHGGFWRERYDRTLMEPLCVDLAAAGWAAWNVEYRRLGAGGGWPWTFVDVATAVDRLAELAGDGALDLRRVAAIGHSAGGHLALWVAARPRLPADAPGGRAQVRVTHAVGQAPVSDLAEAARLGLSGGAAAELLGGGPGERPERYAFASPPRLLPLGVPQLLVHGELDEIVPAAMSGAYVRAAQDAGDDATLVVEAGAAHFEHLDPSSSVWRAVRDWLARHP